MLQVFRGTVPAGVLAGVALLFGTAPVMAQGAKGEAVHIDTVDGVRLRGMFYASPKKNAPTIIFLHKIGDKALQQKIYTGLAEALQPDYSVMLFDFRGHGKSKDINNTAEFWKQPFNVQNIRGGKPNSNKSNLEHGEFSLRYLPALVNDIAAVKAYLDRRNDNHDCNTSSTILVGAESGATLGAIWLNAQWSLVRVVGANPALGQPGMASPNPEGKDVIACIWMSIDSSLSPAPTKNPIAAVSVTGTLQVPVRKHACPTVFMYGALNSGDAGRARALVKALKKSNDNRYEFVLPYPLPMTRLRGMSLAQKSLKIDRPIAEYLDKVVDKHGGEWAKRDFNNTAFMWRNGNQLIPAKLLGQGTGNNLMFKTYEEFLVR